MSDIKSFEEELETHQKAMTTDNYTVIQKAILEHNIIAISKLYNNISFTQLGNLLEIQKAKAEILVANMIAEHRIRATLDQLKDIIYFESGRRKKIIIRQGESAEVWRSD